MMSKNESIMIKSENCHCGGIAFLHGCDWTNSEGPWFVECEFCGFTSLSWAKKSEARKNFQNACRQKLSSINPQSEPATMFLLEILITCKQMLRVKNVARIWGKMFKWK